MRDIFKVFEDDLKAILDSGNEQSLTTFFSDLTKYRDLSSDNIAPQTDADNKLSAKVKGLSDEEWQTITSNPAQAALHDTLKINSFRNDLENSLFNGEDINFDNILERNKISDRSDVSVQLLMLRIEKSLDIRKDQIEGIKAGLQDPRAVGSEDFYDAKFAEKLVGFSDVDKAAALEERARAIWVEEFTGGDPAEAKINQDLFLGKISHADAILAYAALNEMYDADLGQAPEHP